MISMTGFAIVIISAIFVVVVGVGSDGNGAKSRV